MWLGGGMLYLWIIALIFYRYMFFPMQPSDLAPPYWINMGAVAISTLAGTMLVAAAPHSPVLEQLLPFVRGLTFLWWATATWWIPMLMILGVWRHVIRKVPLRYDPLFWVEECNSSAAELSPADKNRLSHRARAMALLKQRLGI